MKKMVYMRDLSNDPSYQEQMLYLGATSINQEIQMIQNVFNSQNTTTTHIL